jgi:hypothetical protein
VFFLDFSLYRDVAFCALARRAKPHGDLIS